MISYRDYVNGGYAQASHEPPAMRPRYNQGGPPPMTGGPPQYGGQFGGFYGGMGGYRGQPTFRTGMVGQMRPARRRQPSYGQTPYTPMGGFGFQQFPYGQQFPLPFQMRQFSAPPYGQFQNVLL